MSRAERRPELPFVAMTAVALAFAGCSTAPPPNDPDAGSGEIVCGNDTDCPAGFVCYAAVCAPECRSNADCASGICNLGSGACEVPVVDTDAGPAGTPDAGPAETPDAGSPDAGLPPAGSPCTTKYECAAGLICKGSPRICKAPSADNSCSADLDCPAGKICNFSKQCEPGCSSPQDCAAPLLCHPNKFICEKCSLTNPCPAGNSCIGESCVPAQACTSTADCSSSLPGSVCKGTAPNQKCANCESHADCRESPYTSENRVCSSAGICEKVTCNDASCRSSLGDLAYCDTAASVCAVRECLTDGDCAASAVGPVCNTATNTCAAGSANCTGQAEIDCNDQCAAQGLGCNLATCTCGGSTGPGGDGDPCTTDADCQTNYACSLGICSPAAVNPAGGDCSGFNCITCVNAVTQVACDPLGCALGSLFGSVICL
jgi:hypothetical protein